MINLSTQILPLIFWLNCQLKNPYNKKRLKQNFKKRVFDQKFIIVPLLDDYSAQLIRAAEMWTPPNLCPVGKSTVAGEYTDYISAFVYDTPNECPVPQSARAVEYTKCISAEVYDPSPNMCPRYDSKPFDSKR